MDTLETTRARPAISAPSGKRAEAIPAPLLLEATRVAGMFQRSVLGHLDHHEWLDRVGKDGQRLIDVLAQMGFVPAAKTAPKAG